MLVELNERVVISILELAVSAMHSHHSNGAGISCDGCPVERSMMDVRRRLLVEDIGTAEREQLRSQRHF